MTVNEKIKNLDGMNIKKKKKQRDACVKRLGNSHIERGRGKPKVPWEKKHQE